MLYRGSTGYLRRVTEQVLSNPGLITTALQEGEENEFPESEPLVLHRPRPQTIAGFATCVPGFRPGIKSLFHTLRASEEVPDQPGAQQTT